MFKIGIVDTDEVFITRLKDESQMIEEIGTTPKELAEILVNSVLDEYLEDNCSLEKERAIMDPYCKNGILLAEFNKQLKRKRNIWLYGIGVFKESKITKVNKEFFSSKQYSFITKDFITHSIEEAAYDYWKYKIKRKICCIISDLSNLLDSYNESDLKTQKFTVLDDAFDKCILIMEICLKIIEPGGVVGFVLPSALISNKNREFPDFLPKNIEIKGISHLYQNEFCNFESNLCIVILKKLF